MSVEKTEEKNEEENADLHQRHHSHLLNRHCPRIQKYQLYVEYQEDEGEQVVPNVKLN